MMNEFIVRYDCKTEGFLEENRGFCRKQMAGNSSLALPPNCAVLP